MFSMGMQSLTSPAILFLVVVMRQIIFARQTGLILLNGLRSAPIKLAIFGVTLFIRSSVFPNLAGDLRYQKQRRSCCGFSAYRLFLQYRRLRRHRQRCSLRLRFYNIDYVRSSMLVCRWDVCGCKFLICIGPFISIVIVSYSIMRCGNICVSYIVGVVSYHSRHSGRSVARLDDFLGRRRCFLHIAPFDQSVARKVLYGYVLLLLLFLVNLQVIISYEISVVNYFSVFCQNH